MKNHPSNELLLAYSDGTIDACNGLTLAAHLETCQHCREQIAELESQASISLQNEPIESTIDEAMMNEMFNNIVNLDKKALVPKLNLGVNVEVNGKKFALPKSLHRVSRHLGEWKNYGGKVYSAHLDIGEDERVSLLYIAAGVQVPQHTHKGVETTLVLHGSFSDESGEYHAGDFTVADASVKHTPKTEEGQDCLCLTVLSDPMVFTQGVARVFNMFGRGMYP
jgi:putative transcriptional regulator